MRNKPAFKVPIENIVSYNISRRKILCIFKGNQQKPVIKVSLNFLIYFINFEIQHDNMIMDKDEYLCFKHLFITIYK